MRANRSSPQDIAARAQEEMRRQAEEAARRAQEAAEARRAAQASKAAPAEGSDFDAEVNEAQRQERPSVSFETAPRRAHVRRERHSVRFTLARSPNLAASSPDEVASNKALAVRRASTAQRLETISNVAMDAGDRVDSVASAATERAHTAALLQVEQIATRAGELQGRLADHGKTGPLGRALDGVREAMPRLAVVAGHAGAALAQVGEAAAGELRGAIDRAKPHLDDVRQMTALCRDALDATMDKATAGEFKPVFQGLTAMDRSAMRAEAQLDVAAGRVRLAEDAALADVNLARARQGFEPLDEGSPPETWLPSTHQVPDEALAAEAAQETPPAVRPLDDAELSAVGSQLPPDGGVQLPWTRNDGHPEAAALAGTVHGRAVEQGLLSAEQQAASADVANTALPGDEVKTFNAADVAAMARDAGLPLEKLDPNQLQQAARFVSASKDVQEQRDRTALALDNLAVAAGGKGPELTRDDMKALVWAQAKVPGHAVEKLSTAELKAKTTEIFRAANAPGEHAFKVGKHDVKLSVAEDGSLAKSETKKPSVWSKIGSIAKVGLKVASFIPGPVGVVARVASAVVSAVDAIRKGKGLLGVVGAVAGAVASGAGAIAGKAMGGVAGAVSKVAGAVSKGLTGLQSGLTAIKQKNLGGILGAVGAVAGAAGDVAGGLGKAAGSFANTMSRVSQYAGAGQSAVGAANALKKGDIGGALSAGLAGAGQFAAARGNDGLAGKLASGASAVDVAGKALAAAKKGDVLGALDAGLGAAAAGASATGHSKLGETLTKVQGYSTTANKVYTSVKTGKYLDAASALSAFASTKVKDEQLKGQLALAGRVFTGAGRATTALKDRRWADAVGVGLQVAGDIKKSDTLVDVGNLVEHGSQLQRAVRKGDWAAADLAAGQFGQSLGTSVEHYRARNVPVPGAAATGEPEVMQLPVRNLPGLNQLVAAVPGAAKPAAPAPIAFDADEPATQPVPVAGAKAAAATGAKPLTFSQDVFLAQGLLNRRLGTSLDVDGLMGPKTERAIADFQRSVGLPGTGQYDAKTKSLLETGTVNAVAKDKPMEVQLAENAMTNAYRLQEQMRAAMNGTGESLLADTFGNIAGDVGNVFTGNKTKMQDAQKALDSHAHALRTILAQPNPNPASLAAATKALNLAVTDAGKLVDYHANTVLPNAISTATAVKTGADVFISVAGVGFPGVQRAYGVLSNGLPQFAENRSFQDNLRAALVNGALGGVSASLGAANAPGTSLGLKLGANVAQAFTGALKKTYNDMAKLDPADPKYDEKYKAILRNAAIDAGVGTATALASGAFDKYLQDKADEALGTLKGPLKVLTDSQGKDKAAAQKALSVAQAEYDALKKSNPLGTSGAMQQAEEALSKAAEHAKGLSAKQAAEKADLFARAAKDAIFSAAAPYERKTKLAETLIKEGISLTGDASKNVLKTVSAIPKDDPKYGDKVKAAFDKEIDGMVSKLVWKAATDPLGKVDPDSPQGKAMKAELMKFFELNFRDSMLTDMVKAARG